jgi:hypothetical protein
MQMLDFNAIQQPTLPVKLKDEAKTEVHLSAPSVELLERLISATPELNEIAATKDARKIRKIYDLVADLMNCNEDGFTFEGEELMTTYKMTFLDVMRFTNAYLGFIKEINEAKN